LRSSNQFKRRQLALADGGSLVLGIDGSIARIAADGSTAQVWKPDDAKWPDQAIRFGLHAQSLTVAPQARRVQGTKPPHR